MYGHSGCQVSTAGFIDLNGGCMESKSDIYNIDDSIIKGRRNTISMSLKLACTRCNYNSNIN